MARIFWAVLTALSFAQAQNGVPVPVPVPVPNVPNVSNVPAVSPPPQIPIAEDSAAEPPPIEGIMVPGKTLLEKLAFLQRRADSHNTYILEVTANENIEPQILEYKGAVNITIILKGDNKNRTIRLKSNGTMFAVEKNVAFILENNITLQGHRRDVGSMVEVRNGGLFVMNAGSAIVGNTEINANCSGGGVYVKKDGSFTMKGGTISGNSTTYRGGGVYVEGTFTMDGGTISGNSALDGGGLYINGGVFTMNSGIIQGNTADKSGSGGGVFVGNGTFNMIDGKILNNTASWGGGGVYRSGNGNFNMLNGYIAGNIAREYGGGVYAKGGYGVQFTKKKGIITGYKSDQDNGNVVRDSEGELSRRGHAVYMDEERHRETTADSDSKLDSGKNGGEGGWEF